MKIWTDYDSYAPHLHAKGGACSARSAALRAALRIGPYRLPALSGPVSRGFALRGSASASQCFHPLHVLTRQVIRTGPPLLSMESLQARSISPTQIIKKFKKEEEVGTHLHGYEALGGACSFPPPTQSLLLFRAADDEPRTMTDPRRLLVPLRPHSLPGECLAMVEATSVLIIASPE